MTAQVDSASGLVIDLAEVVGKAQCLTDPDLMASFTTDWTRRYEGPAVAVVRPSTTDQVAAVLICAARHGAAVVTQGGNTGLVGGSVPRPRGLADGRQQVVLSTTALATIHSCDPSLGLVDADAGVTLGAAQQAARARDRHLGIDLSARGSATLGGMVATNAGGVHVVRFGPMRQRVAGLEAVLADGTVASQLSGLKKDNVGWQLSGLLSGSEGTLAVVTRVLMRLEAEPLHRVTALVACKDADSAVSLAAGQLASMASLEAIELTLLAGMQLVREHSGLREPVGVREGATAWLTVEAAGMTDPGDELAGHLDHPGVRAVAVATDEGARARLWAYRDLHAEAVASLGIPHKLDVAVHPARLAELLDTLPGCVERAAPGSRVLVWGHVGDGNLHVNVVGPPPADDLVDDAVLGLALSLGGSISAEHGIGVAKRRWLTKARSPGSLETMARVKTALDPANMLNPGVLTPE